MNESSTPSAERSSCRLMTKRCCVRERPVRGRHFTIGNCRCCGMCVLATSGLRLDRRVGDSTSSPPLAATMFGGTVSPSEVALIGPFGTDVPG